MYVDFNGKRYEWAWTKEMMARVITAAIVSVGVLLWVLWPREQAVVSRPVQPSAVQPAPIPMPKIISPDDPRYQRQRAGENCPGGTWYDALAARCVRVGEHEGDRQLLIANCPLYGSEHWKQTGECGRLVEQRPGAQCAGDDVWVPQLNGCMPRRK